MRHVAFAGRPQTPWKNGGGTTTEIAVYPEGAGFDAFEWRLSVADIVAEGPFSRFAGVDRVLTLVAGDGLEMTLDGGSVRLDPASAPLAFPGEAEVFARPISGSVRDVNVMTRRGRWRARPERVALSSGARVQFDGEIGLIVALDAGAFRVGGRRVALAAFDALVLAREESCLADGGVAAALVVGLEPVARPNQEG